MNKTIVMLALSGSFLLVSANSYSAPPVTGKPIIVQQLGKLEWPQDNPTITPSLTQLGANDINDLHGDLSCDLIISTAGNYYEALKDAMYGRPDLGHVGLLEQRDKHSKSKVSIFWSTSPSIAIQKINAEALQFKNIKMIGRPALVMAPATVMDTLVANGQVDAESRRPLLSSRGNVILMRADKVGVINTICDLGGATRVVTPHPSLEVSAFGNFSGTLFDVANQNSFGCDATQLFKGIFGQNSEGFDVSGFDNPYNINGVLSVFGRGTAPQGTGARWVASSRIMHRDIPYKIHPHIQFLIPPPVDLFLLSIL